MTVESLLRQAEALTPAEHCELAELLFDRVTIPGRQGLTDAQKAELDRRLTAYRADPNDVTPWEDVETRAAARRAGRAP